MCLGPCTDDWEGYPLPVTKPGTSQFLFYLTIFINPAWFLLDYPFPQFIKIVSARDEKRRQLDEALEEERKRRWSERVAKFEVAYNKYFLHKVVVNFSELKHFFHLCRISLPKNSRRCTTAYGATQQRSCAKTVTPQVNMIILSNKSFIYHNICFFSNCVRFAVQQFLKGTQQPFDDVVACVKRSSVGHVVQEHSADDGAKADAKFHPDLCSQRVISYDLETLMLATVKQVFFFSVEERKQKKTNRFFILSNLKFIFILDTDMRCISLPSYGREGDTRDLARSTCERSHLVYRQRGATYYTWCFKILVLLPETTHMWSM